MSKLLLHVCCAPCTISVNQWLGENGFEVKGLFYNPNIRPREEYERRLITMEYYSTSIGLKVINEPNDRELTPGNCENCYRIRLQRAADYAKKIGHDFFSTTLLVSPYQKHEVIKGVGEEIAVESGVKFFYHDFREGFRAGQQKARELKLYRQKYCGCGIDLKRKERRRDAQVSQPA